MSFRFRDPNAAKEALEKMNGFDLAGRPIRVGLGNDKFTNESTQNLLQRFPERGHGGHGSAQAPSFSGTGGRGTHAGGSNNFDRAGGREEKSGGASALDDTDVAGVNFSNYSRDALMRKLARTDEPAEPKVADKRNVGKARVEAKKVVENVPQASRCIVLKNMFDPAE
jgi:RNA-binding protein 39